MPIKLLLFNPSDYKRSGHITTPWEQIKERVEQANIKPERMKVCDESNNCLPFQIDRIDPADPSRDTLSFSLASGILPGPDDYSKPTSYVTIDESEQMRFGEVEPQLVEIGPKGQEHRIKLVNSRLEVWFNLTPSPEDIEGKWYSGSASSVQLDARVIREILDPDPNMWSHDSEKRCMQMDFIEMSYPAWKPFTSQQFCLIDQPYKLVSKSVGPVRASITVASTPFLYSSRDPFTQEDRHIYCSLYRVISLYAGADYVMDELFVKAMVNKDKASKETVDLYFIPHFFTYLHFLDLNISRFDDIPDWFVVSNLSRPFVSYCFSTDVHVSSILTPHPGYPVPQKEPYSVSWHLPLCKAAKCLHLFARFEPSIDQYEGETFLHYEHRKRQEAKHHFEDRAGKAWYEFIYKPLQAGIL
jgi:hypothetical protein